MYLKRLELVGFKSFADKTVLNFEPGITAVVGPNGCGKSNIFDSIRWVLGEQSVKAMRGSNMEDVIFNGTDKRPGLGFAEVSLTFSNESRMLPIEYEEVTITRRLFRSGDSEYLLNKTQVRLKDILELFMGTGIGAEAYSLVEQGKIDLILSSRPEDRRMIFDEAAGITKYKSKKREALNKLEDTENNLLRVSDIIAEIKRQINSIERQAERARKYKEKFEELKNLELKLSKSQLNDLEAKRLQAVFDIERMQNEEKIFNQQIEETNLKISDYSSKTEELQRNISELKAQDLRFDSTIERNTHHISLNKERINEMMLQVERFREQREQLKSRIAAQAEKVQEFKVQLDSLEALNKEKNDLLLQKTTSLEEIGRAIKSAQDLIARSKLKILDLSSQVSKLKNTTIDINTQVQTHLARKRRLDLEKTKVAVEYSEVKANFDGIVLRIGSVQRELDQINNQKLTKAQEIRQHKEQLDGLQKTIKALEDNKLSLESQKEFIEELKLKYDNIPGQIKGVLLTDQKPTDDSTGIIGKVNKVEEADLNYKALMAGFTPHETKQHMYRLIFEAKYISLDPAQITKKIEELGAQVSESRQQEVSIKAQIELSEKELADIEEAIHQKEMVISNEETQKKSVSDELAKLQDEMGLVETELADVNERVSDLQVKEKELTQESDKLDKENHDLNEVINVNQKLISIKLDEREQATVSIAQLKTELESFRDKKNAQVDTLNMLETALKEDYAELSLLEQEELSSEKRSTELEAELKSLQDEIQKTKVQKEALVKELEELFARNDNVVCLVKQEQEKLASFQTELGSIKKNSYDYQMLQQEISYKEQSIKDKITQTYKLSLDEFQLDPQESIDVNVFSEQIMALKEKLDAFGTVNLVAIEEFEELKKRYEFLTTQQNDLISAKDSLIKTIAKINRTTKVMFADTFEKIAAEFHTYFRLLFGGGDAQLMLMDPENILESGIEIIARPPGKKLQSITLLSGGEKALTAIALIFGVFKVKPSPFCVLDEIDAPLDESNVGRFSYMLKEFTKTSQFIIITHNKRTISNSNVMYGITMEETGVSKIVSVKFAEQEKAAVEVAAA